MLFGNGHNKGPQSKQHSGRGPLGPQTQTTGPEARPPQQMQLDVAPPPGPVFDVGVADFEEKVLRASMEVPVIVDFWAPWCGPCKQLGPVLEAAVVAAGGKVLMAKVNLDECPELAQALRIQSVPTVYAFAQGQPVDGFSGVQPESQIRQFVQKLIEMARQMQPDALDIPETLKAAALALSEDRIDEAEYLYGQIIRQAPDNADAYAGMIRTMIAAGAAEQARALCDQVPGDIRKHSAFQAAMTALDLAGDGHKHSGADDKKTQALRKKVAASPDDHDARIELAGTLFSAGEKDAAIDALLESIRIDREWNDGAARQKLLKFFEALGPADPLTITGRRKLSRLLFS